jgi:hypothetical protein
VADRRKGLAVVRGADTSGHSAASSTGPITNGAEVLDDIAAFIKRFVAFPTEHALIAVVLWAAHTWVTTWYVTPRLILDSAEPGSGKTRVLEILALLVLRPEMTISATVAAIFRMLAEHPYTLLFDEVDAIFNPKNGGNYEDLRGLLNSGYKRGATIARCVGDAKAMKVQRFTVFAPVALAGIAGSMPATITTRAVTIHMRRRGPGEHVEPFRERDVAEPAADLRDRIGRWMTSVAGQVSDARPDMPDGVMDRPAEVWEALLAVADAAGGEWPERARSACRHFVLDAGGATASIGVRLLRDIRTVFGTRERMPTADLVAALIKMDDSPWADLYGKELSARRLAKELERYDVRPVQWRDGTTQPRGYVVAATESPRQVGLLDAWNRYLPDSPVTTVTSVTSQVRTDSGSDRVTDAPVTAPQPVSGLNRQVTDATVVTGASGTSGTWRVSGEDVE